VVDTLLTLVVWLSTNGVWESPMIICFTESQGGCGAMVSFLNSIVIVVSLIGSLLRIKERKQNVVMRKTLDQNTYFIFINLYEQKKGLVSLYLISLLRDLPKKTKT
jgi:hypothetical protein